MHYDKTKRRFIFQNKAALPASAMLFYDLPKLLADDENVCDEVTAFAETLPQLDASLFIHYEDPDAKPHQIEAIEWVLRYSGTGILAYGMGLGKTFIAIRACRALNRKRVLIVCEPHLKNNWSKEVKMWWPEADCHICEGRKSLMPDRARFVVINRDILPYNLEALQRLGIDQMVIDECHKCGAWGTTSYKTVDTVCKDVRAAKGGVLLMTGTLFKNSPMDAHSALHLLNPLIPGPRGVFELRFDPIGHRRQEVQGLMQRRSAPRWLIGQKWAEIKKLEKEQGKNGDVEGLRWMLAQYAIRKRYSDVFPDDGKTRETKFISVDLELTERQRRMLVNSVVLEDEQMKSELSSLLRIVAERKAPYVADYAESWLEENEGKKIVIAGWHISAREIIKTALSRFGVVEIGGTRQRKAKAEEAFANDPNMRVCILNLDSGGTGLNLVSASDLIFSEVPWTSAAFEQVKARIDRMGQKADAIRYSVFIAADTPEGAKFGTVKRKSRLNDLYLG